MREKRGNEGNRGQKKKKCVNKIEIQIYKKEYTNHLHEKN